MSIIPPGFLVHCLTGFQLLAHKSGIIVSDTDLMVFMLMMEMRNADGDVGTVNPVTRVPNGLCAVQI